METVVLVYMAPISLINRIWVAQFIDFRYDRFEIDFHWAAVDCK